MTFALTVLPALLGLGLTSYSRLADLAVHDAYYAHASGRIRGFYLTIEPSAQQYGLVPAGDATVAAFAGLLADQERRWRHPDASLQSHFLPDGTPAMTVTAFGDRSSSSRGRAASPALAGADSARTEPSKAAS